MFDQVNQFVGNGCGNDYCSTISKLSPIQVEDIASVTFLFILLVQRTKPSSSIVVNISDKVMDSISIPFREPIRHLSNPLSQQGPDAQRGILRVAGRFISQKLQERIHFSTHHTLIDQGINPHLERKSRKPSPAQPKRTKGSGVSKDRILNIHVKISQRSV